MRIPSVRGVAAAALNVGDPFRLYSRLVNGIGRYLNRVEAGRRRRRARLVLPLVRADLKRWHATAAIPVAERVRLARRFRRTLYLLYYVSLMDRRLERANLRLFLIGGIVFFAVLPHYVLPTGSELDYLGAIFVAMLGSALAYGLVNAFVNLAAKFLEADADFIKRLQVRGWAGLGLLAGISVWAQLSGASPGMSLAAQNLLLISTGVFGTAVIIFLPTTLYVALLMAIRAWSQHRYPDAFVIRRLFNVLRGLETAGTEWTDLELRSQMAAEIAGAGVLVRQSLLRNFRGRDPVILQWRSRQADRISAAFAEKQIWLMTPKPDTREVLLGWLARSVVALLSGAWDQLELLIGEPATGKTRGGRQLMDAVLARLRTLAIGVLPVLAFVIARRFDLLHELALDLQGYAELALLAWGVLILMFMLDPEGMKDKISTLREAVLVLKRDRRKE
jgi:hypothetical protein